MKLGTSYFGTWDPLPAARDLADIARRHDWIVLPVSEESATYQLENIGRIIRISQALGLETWVSPWGVGGVFGGEGIAGGMSPSKWLGAMTLLKPDVVMFDEPAMSADSLSALVRVCDATQTRTAICLQPERLDAYPPELVNRFGSVGVDPYVADVGEIEEAVRRLYAATKVPDTHLWVQAFRIRAGRERFVEHVIRAADGWGMERIGVWGWRGSAGMGVLRSDQPATVQRAVEHGARG